MITGPQCRAARALIEWTRDTLSREANVNVDAIEEFERKIGEPEPAIRDNLQRALERAGAIFLAENGGGVGVRLKFDQSEVRRIAILESEGGVIGANDVP